MQRYTDSVVNRVTNFYKKSFSENKNNLIDWKMHEILKLYLTKTKSNRSQNLITMQ